MAETIYIGDDITTAEMKVLFGEQDFIDLVYERLGQNAGAYLENMLISGYQLEEAYNLGRLAGLDENDEATAYDAGREDGYDAGYSDGFAEGYSEGFEEGYKKHNPWA